MLLLALGAGTLLPSAAHAGDAGDIATAFDQAFADRPAAASPRTSYVTPYTAPYTAAVPPRSYGGYQDPFQAQLAQLASPDLGRIGVAAYDLSSGQSIAVLGDQPFPMASTSKVAIAATYLAMVDAGRLSLSSEFPLLVPVPSRKFDGAVAPVRPGNYLSAMSLIDLSLTRSNNQATDALLAAVGGPQAVNAWLRRAGLDGMRIDRDIATLVRDDGAIDPATTIDQRDSATPKAMVRMLAGLYQGRWLSPQSRNLLLGVMGRCETGKRRIRGMLPEGVAVAHKTGTLANTASDIGIITMPDGRAIAVAIYVTGQGGKPYRDARIAGIARAIYDGYVANYPAARRGMSR